MPDPIANTVVGAKVVENLVGRILNFILNPITDRITLVRKCQENVENLKREVKKINEEKERLESHEHDARRRGETIDNTVLTWLTDADKIIKAADESVGVGDEFAQKECFFQLCPNPIRRYKLSKKAQENYRDIFQHLEQAAARYPALPFSHPPPLQQDVDAFVEGFEEFPSRMAVLKQIMEALKCPTVNMIGVHGTSGVGKTKLVEMVKGKAKQDGLFTAVVMATVTKDLRSIQEEIARHLEMDLLPADLTPLQAADRIKTRLKEKKKFLVILDDVCDTKINFEKYGVPSASELKQAMEKKNEKSSSGQEVMLRKILLTSGDRNVLSRMIDKKDQVFEVLKLEDDEAWHLFNKTVGSQLEGTDFESVAKEIVKNCLGLPNTIASVADHVKSLARPEQWDLVLADLKMPSPDGISAAVYNPIESSYKYLQGDDLKQTFMLCSLLGHDSSINDLLKYVMGLNLFRKMKTMERTREQVVRMVQSLKQSTLLVDGHSNMHFGMQDQIREFALFIASRDHGVLALVDEDGGEDWPEKERMEKLKWICLSNGYLELRNNGLECPKLTFFHLSNMGCSLEVPTDFFTEAEGLKVLCLTNIDFQSTTSQIPWIPTKLHTLLLDQCVFKVQKLGAIVGNLKNLVVLSLAGCDIEELPREIEQMKKLKLLDVSDCTELRVIPQEVLANLSRSLEELKMGNSFDQWDVEEGNARLTELTKLHKLTALEVHIPNFREILFPEKLKRFKIFIGEVSYIGDSSFESSTIMKLTLQGASITSNHSVGKLLKMTEQLHLDGLNGVQNLVDELDDGGFRDLKCLQVENAPEIRHIFNQAQRLVPSNIFPSLEVMTLRYLEKMEKICCGRIGTTSFKVLRKITVYGCSQLKNLFSFSMAKQLQRLQEIEVLWCNNIEQIINDVEEQGCKLGNLLSLKLRVLPKLIRFNSNCMDISLFNDKVMFPNLEKLNLAGIKINQLWITSSYAVTSQESLNFRKLKSLQIDSCSSLEYLFTPSMASSLVQLENLYVSSCQDLKQVIMAKGVEEIVNEEMVNTELTFPQLNYISLMGCLNLSSFCAGSCALKFQSAIQITIEGCPNMITFASAFSIEHERESLSRN